MKENSASPVGVGVLTILTVLLVLTLAIFAVLTYSSSRADLALSRVNADTVSAFYQADAEAERLAAEFEAGTGQELELTLPITQMQALHIHLQRNADGTCQTLAWNTVAIEQEVIDQTLNVWEGS